MSEPTLDHLTVSHYNATWGEWEDTRKLTPAEFDRIATERGFVKRPVCKECFGSGKELDEASAKAVAAAVGIPVEELDNGPCDFCGGTGYKRLVALDGIDVEPPIKKVLHHFGAFSADMLTALSVAVLAAIDQEAT